MAKDTIYSTISKATSIEDKVLNWIAYKVAKSNRYDLRRPWKIGVANSPDGKNKDLIVYCPLRCRLEGHCTSTANLLKDGHPIHLMQSISKDKRKQRLSSRIAASLFAAAHDDGIYAEDSYNNGRHAILAKGCTIEQCLIEIDIFMHDS